MTLLLRMDDKMNRQLSSTVQKSDQALALAEELVHYGFINEVIFHFWFSDFNVNYTSETLGGS